MKKENSDIKVFICLQDSTCSECGKNLARNELITLDSNKKNICLSCADLQHLIFLPSGDAALSRRARKYSTLSAVVFKLNRSRKVYERQGLLVESNGLELAEKECLSDKDYRERRKERESIRRAQMDQKYIQEFAIKIHELYPGCPEGREYDIAEHACLKYSGRVGRSASAKKFSEDSIRLAVIAHIRHVKTNYDELLSQGCDRDDARMFVEDTVTSILLKWRN